MGVIERGCNEMRWRRGREQKQPKKENFVCWCWCQEGVSGGVEGVSVGTSSVDYGEGAGAIILKKRTSKKAREEKTPRRYLGRWKGPQIDKAIGTDIIVHGYLSIHTKDLRWKGGRGYHYPTFPKRRTPTRRLLPYNFYNLLCPRFFFYLEWLTLTHYQTSRFHVNTKGVHST